MPVTIDALNPDGRGRGTDGEKTYLVSQALPGERVEVRADRESSRTIQGRVESWRIEGETIDHACQHVGTCTGCPLLRAPEDLESKFKLDVLRGWIDPAWHTAIRPVKRPSELFGYRHYAKLVATMKEGRLMLGSYVSGTHEVADNRDCPVLVPALSKAMEDTRDRLDGIALHRPGLRYVVARISRSSGRIMLVLVTSGEVDGLQERMAGCEHSVYAQVNRSDGNVILSGSLVHLLGPRYIEDEMLGFTHRIGPTSFFQINPVSAETMFRHAVEAAGTGARCVEGYCGVGVLTLPLLERFGQMSANELNEEAVAILRDRAPRELTVKAGRAEDVLVHMLRPEADAVVLDPPRRGLGFEVASAVKDNGAERVVLLSCNPRSLMNDLPVLTERYAIESITPFDQFPRTAHVETVTVLSRRR